MTSIAVSSTPPSFVHEGKLSRLSLREYANSGNLCVLFSFRTTISVTEVLRLFSNMVSPRAFSCVNANTTFSAPTDIHLLSPASATYPTKPEQYASRPVPSLGDWQELWAAWDMVTRGMTPEEELLSKPIKLRNDLIFYLGHIPGFCGMLSRGKAPWYTA
jgi:hypothetical protein